MGIPVDDQLLPLVADLLDIIDPDADSAETWSIVERWAAKDPVAAISVATSIGTIMVHIAAGAVPTTIAEMMKQVRIYVSQNFTAH